MNLLTTDKKVVQIIDYGKKWNFTHNCWRAAGQLQQGSSHLQGLLAASSRHVTPAVDGVSGLLNTVLLFYDSYSIVHEKVDHLANS